MTGDGYLSHTYPTQLYTIFYRFALAACFIRTVGGNRSIWSKPSTQHTFASVDCVDLCVAPFYNNPHNVKFILILSVSSRMSAQCGGQSTLVHSLATLLRNNGTISSYI